MNVTEVKKQIGYCTNVHSGVTIEQIQANLDEYTAQVRKSFCPDKSMGIGLWLCNDACQQLIKSRRTAELAGWMKERMLSPFTMNGFPYRDFHQPVVKHLVYQPNWADQARLDYTVSLARIQARLLGDEEYGTISTLPLGWPDADSPEFRQKCADQLLKCSEELAELRVQTGKHIFLCIEPEPGCVIDSSEALTKFFDQYLLTGKDESNQRVLEYIGVCHDICHSAVMFEPQKDAIENYRSHGVRVGKFQVSSALQTDFDHVSDEERETLIKVLHQFAEDRYLHQTVIWDGSKKHFHEDLSDALKKHSRNPFGKWRVHFHVPIFATRLAVLRTTQDDIKECFECIDQEQETPLHFEIETYAWTVLPDSLKPKSLAEGIAKELIWFRDECLSPTSE